MKYRISFTVTDPEIIGSVIGACKGSATEFMVEPVAESKKLSVKKNAHLNGLSELIYAFARSKESFAPADSELIALVEDQGYSAKSVSPTLSKLGQIGMLYHNSKHASASRWSINKFGA